MKCMLELGNEHKLLTCMFVINYGKAVCNNTCNKSNQNNLVVQLRVIKSH